ncbi:hypothetical protein BRC97_09435 [Halobacteriales archaeon QS_6_71_20]|nr:MAG: hypothetical protein BRC97_09435 [Halobacteriales archaeon QS_6_71_20]
MTPNDGSDRDSRTDRSLTADDRRRFLAGAGGTLGALALGTGFGAAPAVADGDDDEKEEDEEKEDDEASPFATVEFSNQYSDGEEIVVDSTVLSDGGYVAIHDATLFEGAVADSVIGVSEYLEPGAHYDVEVTLFDVPGREFDRHALEEPALLVPMPHRETDDDETYDFVDSGGEEDGPYTEDGLPTVDAGAVIVGDSDDSDHPGHYDGGDDEEAFALVDFRNQSEIDDEAVVRDVTLSDGGFVALHDARLLSGKPFESVVGVSEYLDPGHHQSVEVEVDDADEIAEVDLPARPLVPIPYRDTDDDETYGFVDSHGEKDGPYTKAGVSTIDAGLVTIED